MKASAPLTMGCFFASSASFFYCVCLEQGFADLLGGFVVVVRLGAGEGEDWGSFALTSAAVVLSRWTGADEELMSTFESDQLPRCTA